MNPEETAPHEEPLFNIGAVARMTDIPEATLRMWERRYQFPRSARTAGGHRLYSQQEVERLQKVKRHLDNGMQVSLAIQALRHAEQESTLFHTEQALSPTTELSLETLRRRMVEALVEHDLDSMDAILGECLTVYPLEYLVLDVISPVLNDIGEAWIEGRIDVATEHFATNALRHRLLMWMRTGPPAYHVSPVVLACAPGDLHEGSLLMLGVLLRRLRWPVIYLGQSMPLSDLAAFVDDVEPSIIVFVAQMEDSARALSEWPHWLGKAAKSKRPVVSYGGRAFVEHPELVEHVPGVLLGTTLREGIATIDRLLHDMNPLLR
jgi:DNA-binding transcriptional MerR regulator